MAATVFSLDGIDGGDQSGISVSAVPVMSMAMASTM